MAATKKPAKKKRKPKVKALKCKKCGYSFLPLSDDDLNNRKKEWTMVSPMPDKNGDVTITAMASWNCPSCGKNITGSYGKTKGDFGGKSKTERIRDKLDEKVSFNVADFAKEIGVDEANLTKILTMMVKKGTAEGKIASGKFTPT
jgi:transposase-like protein